MNTAVVEREPITISLVAQHVFCPRRAWLEQAALERLLRHDDDSLLICEVGPIAGLGDARLRFVGAPRRPSGDRPSSCNARTRGVRSHGWRA